MNTTKSVAGSSCVRSDPPGSGIFLNLSNHPCERWTEPQVASAKVHAPLLVDLPFPNVDPDLDEQGVDELVAEIVSQVPQETTAALVQGEFTLCFRLVQALEARGIPCFAATSERRVVQVGERKESRFRFVRLRRYR